MKHARGTWAVDLRSGLQPSFKLAILTRKATGREWALALDVGEVTLTDWTGLERGTLGSDRAAQSQIAGGLSGVYRGSELCEQSSFPRARLMHLLSKCFDLFALADGKCNGVWAT